LPVSAEVWGEHIERHPCDAGVVLPIVCSCDAVALVACGACGEPLGLWLQPGREFCEHGFEILELAADPRPWAHWSTWVEPGVEP